MHLKSNRHHLNHFMMLQYQTTRLTLLFPYLESTTDMIHLFILRQNLEKDDSMSNAFFNFGFGMVDEAGKTLFSSIFDTK
mmetsp:Transcript_26352/g.64220  ORF Transcript_26352/g.64220 Transcript_26352/m.64220 type:complete len:80 (-) Transcript_26352:177-416(-)